MENSAYIDDLNRRFAIPGAAQVIAGSGSLPKIKVTTPASSAEIYLHGAQLVSFVPAGGEELIFLSRESHFVDGRAIRGGVPICFPWFRGKSDDPKAPAHGFVRTRAWQLDSIASEREGVVATLSTQSDDSTRKWWPHEFQTIYRISVAAALHLELTVINTGADAFRFEEALHTYFRVGDAKNVRVRGLDQAAYLDNNDANRRKVQSGDVSFTAPTDYAFLATTAAPELIDPLLHRILRTAKQNSATTVVWNPWQQGAAALADLGDDEWQQFACVEASNILDAAVTLESGAQHTLSATISVSAA
jgi:glucose-6-phosphate 1-epimerase